MARRALTTCSAGCGALVERGRCTSCSTQAEQRRGSSAARGYGAEHRDRFRAGVIDRDVCCVLCRERDEWELATVADHWPLSRRELEDRGLDPNDPAHGRGLCHTCHSRETSTHQPGGWHQA